MKTKVLLLVAMLFAFTALFAQSAETVTDTGALDWTSILAALGSFSGIVGVTSTLVTEIIKRIAKLEKPVLKILTAILVGEVLTWISFASKIGEFLQGIPLWQVALYGLFAGLSGVGFYELVKAVMKLLGWKDKADDVEIGVEK